MGLQQYNASQDIKTTRRFYSGTSKLRNGMVLAYVAAATKTDADPKLRLGSQVGDLAASNVNLVAGIVPDTEAGKNANGLGTTVEVLQPQAGDVFDAEVDGAVAVAAGDFLKPDNTKGALIKDAAVAVGVTFAKALEAQAVNGKVVIRCLKI